MAATVCKDFELIQAIGPLMKACRYKEELLPLEAYAKALSDAIIHRDGSRDDLNDPRTSIDNDVWNVFAATGDPKYGDLRAWLKSEQRRIDSVRHEIMLSQAEIADRIIAYLEVWLLPSGSAEDPPELAPGDTWGPSPQALEPSEHALRGLLHAVEKHRLIFLYFTEAWRRNPMTRDDGWEKVTHEDRPEYGIPVEAIDSEGDFLFEYRHAMEAFALAAMSCFGAGAGSKPKAMVPGGGWVEIEGGDLPVWQLGEGGDLRLNDSADSILTACRALARADVGRHLSPLIQEARSLTHDEGQSRWHCSNFVRWKYLTKLDELIRSLKLVDVGNGETPTSGPETLPPTERTDDECDGSPKIKPAHAKAWESYKWVSENRPELVPPEDSCCWYSQVMYEVAIEESGVYDEESGPSYETWIRYLRQCRNAIDGPKNTPRAGREYGGSIAGAGQI